MVLWNDGGVMIGLKGVGDGVNGWRVGIGLELSWLKELMVGVVVN